MARTAVPATGNGKVYFDSNRDDVNNHEIYSLVPGADDATAARLTTSPLSDYEPSVSLDGTKLAFERDGTIWTMNADGSGQVSTGVQGYSTSWSPDASRIAFVFRSSNFNSYGADGIGIMDADGSHAVVLLQDVPDTFLDLAWSPDGSRIAFGFKQPGVGHYHIGVIAADGRGPIMQLTNAAADDRSVAWSPDGTKLVFARGSVQGGPLIGTVVMINADGTGEHTVYDGGNDFSKSVFEVTWSPDGTTLLLRVACCDLYTVPSAGGPATLFARGGAQSGQHESPFLGCPRCGFSSAPASSSARWRWWRRWRRRQLPRSPGRSDRERNDAAPARQ